MNPTLCDSYQLDDFGRGEQLNILSGIIKRISKVAVFFSSCSLPSQLLQFSAVIKDMKGEKTGLVSSRVGWRNLCFNPTESPSDLGQVT